MTAMRLALGVPDGSRDLVLEKSILLEAGFDELNGVDWQKGCYIGQELTARTKYRGLIKKRLFPVRIDGPRARTRARRHARRQGSRRDALGRDGLGLALLRLEAVAAQRPFAAEGARVTPIRPDWIRLDAGHPSPASRESAAIRCGSVRVLSAQLPSRVIQFTVWTGGSHGLSLR